jgi:hypothetical protein
MSGERLPSAKRRRNKPILFNTPPLFKDILTAKFEIGIK